MRRQAVRLHVRHSRILGRSGGLSSTLSTLTGTRSRLIHGRGLTAIKRLARKLISHVLGPVGCVGGFTNLSTGLVGSLGRGVASRRTVVSGRGCTSDVRVLSVVGDGLRGVGRRNYGAIQVIGTVRRLLGSHRNSIAPASVYGLYGIGMSIVHGRFGRSVRGGRVRVRLSYPTRPAATRVGVRRVGGIVLGLLGGDLCTLLGGLRGGSFAPVVGVRMRGELGKAVFLDVHSGNVNVRSGVGTGVFRPFFAAGPATRTTNINLCLYHRIVLGRRKSVVMGDRGSGFARFVVAVPVCRGDGGGR